MIADPGIEVVEHALVLDLLRAVDGAVCGATLHVLGEGQRDGVGAVHARAVVLATGGLGQVFSQTTNPRVSTGDGVAVALRAGAVVADLEFVQFHPTVLWLGSSASGQQPLISEAVRGEGAWLVDDDGKRFMVGQHELAELAPRDVVAKGIMRRMRETGAAHVWLDARHLGAETWARRFPTILESCRSHGIDPVTQLIPVAPACHYASGGVRTDLEGRTSVPGSVRLRRGGMHGGARREPLGLQQPARRTRVRGANRRRSGARAARMAGPRGRRGRCGIPVPGTTRPSVAEAMTEGAGCCAATRVCPRPSMTSLRLRGSTVARRARRTGGHESPYGGDVPRGGGAASGGDPRITLARGLPRS